MYPLYSHSIVLQQSSFIGQFERKILFPADLECHCFLIPNDEINKVFIELSSSNFIYIINARARCCATLSDHINSLGEIWMTEYISSENSTSLKSYNYMSKISPDVYQNYLQLKHELKDLKADDSTDIYYAEFLNQKNKNRIKKIQKQVTYLEKVMANAQPGERVKFIHQLIDKSKYSNESSLELTKTAKQALLTHAQVLMDSSETAPDEIKFSNIWMAYELCRIGGHMLCYIEMLRCRSRPIILSMKKHYKGPALYCNATGLADIYVYEKLGCMTNASETIMNLLEIIDMHDNIKVFLLQKAVLAWSLSYKTDIFLPSSFEVFLPIKPDTIINDKYKVTDKLLEYCCEILIEFSIKAIPDKLKQRLVEIICDCIAFMIKTVVISNKIVEILNKPTFKNIAPISKSLVPYHCVFQMIEELPNLKTTYEGTHISIKHQIKYPQDELDKEWIIETKRLALHQFCANFMSKKMRQAQKLEKKEKKTLMIHEYLIQAKKIINKDISQAVEVCYKYLKELFNAFYKITLFKSLDMHYLLDQIIFVNNSLQNLTIESSNEVILDTNTAIHRLYNWKIMVQPQNIDNKEKIKKKWNINWRKRVNDIKNKH